MFSLLPLSFREWQHHPWRHSAAVLAVGLGVALAWSVHLINTSALQEFASAVRSANGQADAVVRGARDGFDEAVLDRLAADPAVLAASPVVEVDTYARSADGSRVAVKLLGIDLFSVAAFAPDLLPRPHDAIDNRLAPLDPLRLFSNLAARERLGLSGAQAQLALQSGPSWLQRQWSGDVAAGGGPLLVSDIAGVQAGFGMVGRLSRIDLKLAPGATATHGGEPLVQALRPLAPGLSLSAVEDSQQRVSNLSARLSRQPHRAGPRRTVCGQLLGLFGDCVVSGTTHAAVGLAGHPGAALRAAHAIGAAGKRDPGRSGKRDGAWPWAPCWRKRP